MRQYPAFSLMLFPWVMVPVGEANFPMDLAWWLDAMILRAVLMNGVQPPERFLGWTHTALTLGPIPCSASSKRLTGSLARP